MLLSFALAIIVGGAASAGAPLAHVNRDMAGAQWPPLLGNAAATAAAEGWVEEILPEVSRLPPPPLPPPRPPTGPPVLLLLRDDVDAFAFVDGCCPAVAVAGPDAVDSSEDMVDVRCTRYCPCPSCRGPPLDTTEYGTGAANRLIDPAFVVTVDTVEAASSASPTDEAAAAAATSS